MTIQIFGAILGIAGSFLVASTRQRVRAFAFLCWIISNCFLIGVFATMQDRTAPLILMQSLYLLTSILGLMNNWPNRTVRADD